MSTQQTQVDDLTAIRGIGRSRQKWFDQVFAVRTYDQLALLPADTIEAALKAAGILPTGRQSGYDPDAGLYAAVIDTEIFEQP